MPWAITVGTETNEVISIIGVVTAPAQIVDRTTSECLYAAQKQRMTKTPFADEFITPLRVTTLDGAASNEKVERIVGARDRPRRLCAIHGNLHLCYLLATLRLFMSVVFDDPS